MFGLFKLKADINHVNLTRLYPIDETGLDGSVPSLVAGLAFGSMAAAGAYQTTNNPKDVRLSLATSALVLGVMGMRFINTGKWMPAGLIAGASLLLVLKHGFYMTIGKYD